MTRSSPAGAFSLVELLCVGVIIGILAGLLLTAVASAFARVKRMQREFEVPTRIKHFRDRLTGFCEAYPVYPALTARQLHELGVFDGAMMELLRWRGVEFHPFSSADPTNKIVLEVWHSKKEVERILKSDLRRPEP